MASPPGPPTYGGPMYYPQPIEGMLTRRNVFALNALGLIGIYLGILFRLATSDLNVRGLAHLRPAEHRPPGVGRPPAHVHAHRLRVDLSRLNRGPGSPRRTPGRRSLS